MRCKLKNADNDVRAVIVKKKGGRVEGWIGMFEGHLTKVDENTTRFNVKHSKHGFKTGKMEFVFPEGGIPDFDNSMLEDGYCGMYHVTALVPFSFRGPRVQGFRLGYTGEISYFDVKQHEWGFAVGAGSGKARIKFKK